MIRSIYFTRRELSQERASGCEMEENHSIAGIYDIFLSNVDLIAFTNWTNWLLNWICDAKSEIK